MKKKTMKIVAWFALLAMLLGIIATLISPLL